MARMYMPVFRPPPPPRPPMPRPPAPPRISIPPPRISMPSPPRAPVPTFSAPKAPAKSFSSQTTAQKIASVNAIRPGAVQSVPGMQARAPINSFQQVPRAINAGNPGGINTKAAAIFAYNKPPSTPTSRDGGAGWMRGGSAGGGGGGGGGVIFKDNIIKRYGNKYENFLFNAQQYKRGKGAENLARRGGQEYDPYGDAGEAFSALEAQSKFTNRRGPYNTMANTFSINPAMDSSAIDTEGMDFLKERALQRSINS